MSGGAAWRWDRRGRIALAVLAGFQVLVFVAGKLDAAQRSRQINETIASAEGVEKALAFVGGVLSAASSGYWIVWTWLVGSALLLVPVAIFRPRRVRP